MDSNNLNSGSNISEKTASEFATKEDVKEKELREAAETITSFNMPKEEFLPVAVNDNTDNYIKRIILCLIYAIFFTFCLYKNHTGITYPLFALATIVSYVLLLKASKEKVKVFSYFLMAIIMVLSVNVCTTTSIPLIVFDKIFVFALFFVMFLNNLYDDKTWDVTRYFASAFTVIFSSIVYFIDPILDPIRISKNSEGKTEEQKKASKKKLATFGYVLAGIGISVPILCVVLPLLSSSDAVFSHVLKKVFTVNIDADLIGVFFLSLLIFIVGYAMLKRLHFRINWMESPVKDLRTFNPAVAITISSVLLVFYGLYSVIQIVFLFLGFGTLPEGYTYANYAREGFFQLVFVCIINLILVLICRKFSKDNIVLRIMLTLISVCTFIMIFSSAYRMILYIGVYGLTFLRVYVLWALTVIALAMTGTVIFVYKDKMPFVKYSIIVLTLTWAIFGIAHPDVYIAKYNLNLKTGERYVIRELSDDAIPVIFEHMDELESNEKMNDNLKWFDNYLTGYSEPEDYRHFNFAKHKIYKAVKEYNQNKQVKEAE